MCFSKTSVRQSFSVLSLAVLLACPASVTAQVAHIDAGFGTTCITYSPDGRFLATAGCGNRVKIWDIASKEVSVSIALPIKPNKEIKRQLELSKHGEEKIPAAARDFFLYGSVGGLSYSPDGKVLAALSIHPSENINKTGTLFLCDPAKGNVKQTIDIEFKPDGFKKVPRTGKGGFGGGGGSIWGPCESVAFSYQGAYVIAAAGHVRMWDRKGKLVRSLRGVPGCIVSFAASVSHELLATVDLRGTIQVIDYAGKSLFRQESRRKRPLEAVAFSGDGRYVAFTQDKRVGLIDVPSRRRILDLTSRGSSRPISCIAFSPDSTLLAAGDDDGKVAVWDVRHQRIAATVPDHSKDIKAIAFSPDGKTLAYLSSTGVVLLHPLKLFTLR